MKHFEFTGETKSHFGITLRQIRATVDISIHGVYKGDIGGWIEKEENLYGSAWVSGDARVSGDAWVYGNARVSGSACICYMSGFGSECRTTTAYKTKSGEIEIVCGCFTGNIEEFKNQVIETYADGKHAREYLAMIELIKAKFDIP